MSENHPTSEIILYQTEDGITRVEVRLQNETVRLSLAQMADLFQRDKSSIFKQVRDIFAEGELASEATVANFAIVQSEGEREVAREIDHYNLDVIISVGYHAAAFRCVGMEGIEVEAVHRLPARKGKVRVFWHAGEERVIYSGRLGGGTHISKLRAVRDQARTLDRHPFSGIR